MGKVPERSRGLAIRNELLMGSGPLKRAERRRGEGGEGSCPGTLEGSEKSRTGSGVSPAVEKGLRK